MLRRVDDLKNFVLEAEDGEVGRCKDFLFDDRWLIRYMVADTGKWLPGRKVLISPASLGTPRWGDRRLPVKATIEHIRNSPPLEIDEPVTREHERLLYDYWTSPHLWGGYATPETPYSAEGQVRGYFQTTNPEARNLESAEGVIGFHIEATDGDIGHVKDFLLDDEDWAIRYVVVDTRNWLPGRKVVVGTGWFRDVHWSDRKVTVKLTRDQIENSPDYVEGRLDRDYENQLHRHYGLPPYWKES